MNDMISLKAKPTSLCMAEAVPFGQVFNYFSPHPMDAVLDDKGLYFLPVKDHFRAGDTLRIVRVENDRVRELVGATVIEVGMEFVELRLTGEIEVVPDRGVEKAVEPEDPEIYVQSDVHGECSVRNVMAGRGVVVDTHGNDLTKALPIADAKAIRAGNMPIPQPQPAPKPEKKAA